MTAPLDRECLIAECERNEAKVAEIVGRLDYAEKGIFNSELLFFVSASTLLEVEYIIESGRAKGYSTQFIAEFFDPDEIEIHSIELYRRTEDAKLAEARLADYPNVSLHYGDATERLPEFVSSNPTVVLVDGPKGDAALKLAMDALGYDGVVATFVHDLHRNTPHRDWGELLFGHRLFSDDEEFVDRFAYLDQPCWDTLPDSWQPYLRDGESIDSYASTLGGFFDGPKAVNPRRRDNFQRYRTMSDSSIPLSTLFRRRAAHKLRIAVRAVRSRIS